MTSSIELISIPLSKADGGPLDAAFQLPSDRTFDQVSDGGLTTVFSTLACYHSADADGIRIRLAATVLPNEISAGDLAELAARQRNDRIVKRRDIDTAQAELLCSTTNDGDQQYCRSRVVRCGNHAWQIEASASEDSGSKIADMCSNIAMSLQLLRPESFEPAESLIEYTLQDEWQTTFQYPESWTVERLATGRSGVMSQQHTGGNRVGTIEIETLEMLGKPELAKVCEKQKELLESQGMKVESGAIIQVESPASFDTAFCYAPRIHLNGVPKSCGTIILYKSNCSVILSLTTQGRENGFANWSIARRAYEIIRDSLSANVK